MCKLAEIVKTSRCLRQIRLVSVVLVHASVSMQHMYVCIWDVKPEGVVKKFSWSPKTMKIKNTTFSTHVVSN